MASVTHQALLMVGTATVAAVPRGWQQPLSGVAPSVARDRSLRMRSDASSYVNNWLHPIAAVVTPGQFGWGRALSSLAPSIRRDRSQPFWADAASYAGAWLRPPGPTGVTGLIGWWDASVFASLTIVAGRVNAVADQSGAGNHVTASVSPFYDAVGLNSRPTMTWSAPNMGLVKDNFAFGTGNTLTAFFVGQYNKPGYSYGRAISYSAGPGYTGIFGSTTDQDNDYSFSLGQEASGDNVVLYRNASIANRYFPGDGTPHRCIATISSSGVMTIYVDGVATVGSTLNAAFASTPSQLQLGNVSSTPGNSAWNGQLSEIGISQNYSDVNQVAALDTYLKNKWGL